MSNKGLIHSNSFQISFKIIGNTFDCANCEKCCSTWQLSSTRVSFLRGSIYLARPLALDCHDVEILVLKIIKVIQRYFPSFNESMRNSRKPRKARKIVHICYEQETLRQLVSSFSVVSLSSSLRTRSRMVTSTWPLRSPQNLHFFSVAPQTVDWSLYCSGPPPRQQLLGPYNMTSMLRTSPRFKTDVLTLRPTFCKL